MNELEFQMVDLLPRQLEIYEASSPQSKYDTIIAITGRQVGKVQPIDTIVYNKQGALKLGELKVGDYIQSGWNSLTKVLAIYEHKDWQFYKITFRDGTYTYAGLEHLWFGYDIYRKECVKSTQDIISDMTKYKKPSFFIPTSKLTFDEQFLSIDPYLLGLLIGDGCITTKTISITTNDSETIDYVSKECDGDVRIDFDKRSTAVQLVFKGLYRKELVNKLTELGLLGCNSSNKFIPDIYKYSSEDQRIELIRGLMDTDGYCSKEGIIEFVSKSERLRDDVQWLLKSVGIYTRVYKKYNKKYDRWFYYLRPATNKAIFKLKRKLDRRKYVNRFNLNPIISIEEAYRQDGRCITVDHPKATYVCDNNIMTHNTLTATQIVLNWMFQYDGAKIGFFMPTRKQCVKVFNQLLYGLEDIKTLFDVNKTYLTITSKVNKAFVKFITAQNDNFRGDTYDLIIVDEACFVKDEIYQAGIRATVMNAITLGYGKQVLLSTPKWKNWFYNASLIEENTRKVIKFTSQESGRYSEKVIEQLKKELPEHVFNNEYMAEFLEEGNGLFKWKQCVMTSTPTDLIGVSAGLDFGVEEDYTVLTILNKKGEVICLKKWYRVDWMDLLDEVVKQLKEYGSPTVYCETNGIGNMPTKTLRHKYSNTRDFTTTNKTKNDIINKLALDFANQNIWIPNDASLQKELDAFSMTMTSTGKITYGGSGGFHDDQVMSLAIANYHRTSGTRLIVKL
jgi:hypothetical protein